MNNCSDLVKAVVAGRRIPVEFGKKIEIGENYLEAGMRGEIFFGQAQPDGVVFLRVDVSNFKEHNLLHETPNYYDAHQRPTLTASQAGHYPKDSIEDVYLSADMLLEGLITPLATHSSDLFAEYSRESNGRPYISWLEDQLVAARTAP